MDSAVSTNDGAKSATGVHLEQHFFKWNVVDFSTILTSDDLLNDTYEFTVGNVSGSWIFYLSTKTIKREKWLSLYGSRVPPKYFESENPDIWAFCRVSVKNIDGSLYLMKQSEPRRFRGSEGFGWAKFIAKHKRNKLTDLPVVDDVLTIYIDFTIMNLDPDKTSDTYDKFPLAQRLMSSACTKSLDLLTDEFEDLNLSDVTIVSRDGKEFQCHKVMLAVRSPVFATLFRSKMKECQTGIIKLDDLSGRTVKLLLEYLYSGMIPTGWNKPAVISEFTYAAGKYELTELLEFLDNMVSFYCNEENAVKMLSLSNKLSLKIAEKQLSEYLKHVVASTTSTDSLLKLFTESSNANNND